MLFQIKRYTSHFVLCRGQVDRRSAKVLRKRTLILGESDAESPTEEALSACQQIFRVNVLSRPFTALRQGSPKVEPEPEAFT